MAQGIQLRRAIRKALNVIGRPATSTILKDTLRGLGYAGFEEMEFLDAREWNQAEGYIDFRRNREIEADVWFLTEAGKASLRDD